MKVPRREMNRRLSEICDRYDLDYWVWTPADFDLSDPAARADMLARHESLYRDCRRLDAVFFPGGDPGQNPPELVLPFLEDIAERLISIHPEAKIWLSLQWFNPQQVDFIYAYLEREAPTWLGGLVTGPSSPPIAETRRRLPAQYRLRRYPDITHNKLCQYPVPWWDQAYALTLGREAINPRPVQYAQIYRWYAPYADGFITYSDGVHDDVNKVVWSALGWDPNTDVRDILVQYSRFFFGDEVAEAAADGILALEKNWQGALADNGAVDGTLLLWQQLEERSPQLHANWRWQMNLLRAHCDAYIRHRLLYESALEREANAILAEATTRGADAAMDAAREVLGRATTAPCRPELRNRIDDLCEALFRSVCLQTSVPRYFASGAERGAFLDFIDYPLNNRWWLEDEFAKVAALPTEAEKCQRLETIGTWETPGPGSFYDDIGHVGRSPHVRRGEAVNTDPIMRHISQPTFWWWDDGKSRARLSWQCTMDWPLGVVYEGLDPQGTYTVRLTGYGQSLLRLDGDRVTPSVDGKEIGEFKEFHVPPHLVQDGRLVLTWDSPDQRIAPELATEVARCGSVAPQTKKHVIDQPVISTHAGPVGSGPADYRGSDANSTRPRNPLVRSSWGIEQKSFHVHVPPARRLKDQMPVDDPIVFVKYLAGDRMPPRNVVWLAGVLPIRILARHCRKRSMTSARLIPSTNCIV